MEQTEAKPEKTPGDLKREGIAQKLDEEKGGVWKWFTNYSPKDSPEEKHSFMKLEFSLRRWLNLSTIHLKPQYPEQRLSAEDQRELDGRKTIITSYNMSQPAFDSDGNLIDGMDAVYIQCQPQENSSL